MLRETGVLVGYSNFWLGVRGGQRDQVLKSLGLESTGEWSDPCDTLQGVGLPTGWYLVISNFYDPQLRLPKTLMAASKDTEVVTCGFEEHSMESTASGWRDGVCTWSIEHNLNRGTWHLITTGSLPAEFAAIRDRQISKQQAAGGGNSGVDHIYEIAIALAQSATGFCHDRIPMDADLRCENLRWI